MKGPMGDIFPYPLRPIEKDQSREFSLHVSIFKVKLEKLFFGESLTQYQTSCSSSRSSTEFRQARSVSRSVFERSRVWNFEARTFWRGKGTDFEFRSSISDSEKNETNGKYTSFSSASTFFSPNGFECLPINPTVKKNFLFSAFRKIVQVTNKKLLFLFVSHPLLVFFSFLNGRV